MGHVSKCLGCPAATALCRTWPVTVAHLDLEMFLILMTEVARMKISSSLFRRDQRSTTPRFMRSLLSRRSVLWQGLILRSLNFDPLPSWTHSSILLLLRVKLLEQRLTKLVASGSVESDGTTSVKLQVNLKT